MLCGNRLWLEEARLDDDWLKSYHHFLIVFTFMQAVDMIVSYFSCTPKTQLKCVHTTMEIHLTSCNL